MAWTRLDDNYDTHRKILGLPSDVARWTWTRVLLYTGRQRSSHVPHSISDAIPKATPDFLERCRQLGLLDIDANGDYHVHDWILYTDADPTRKLRYLMTKHPDISANEAHRIVGGRRSDTLQIFSDLHAQNPATTPPNQYPGTTNPGSTAVPKRYPGTVPAGTRPDPELQQQQPALQHAAAEPLTKAGWTPAQLRRATESPDELDRALRLLEECQADPGVRSPGALAWALFDAGAVSRQEGVRQSLAVGAVGLRSTRVQPVDVDSMLAAIVAGRGWDDATSEDAIGDDLERAARRAGVELSGEQRDSAIAAWRVEYGRRYGRGGVQEPAAATEPTIREETPA